MSRPTAHANDSSPRWADKGPPRSTPLAYSLFKKLCTFLHMSNTWLASPRLCVDSASWGCSCSGCACAGACAGRLGFCGERTRGSAQIDGFCRRAHQYRPRDSLTSPYQQSSCGSATSSPPAALLAALESIAVGRSGRLQPKSFLYFASSLAFSSASAAEACLVACDAPPTSPPPARRGSSLASLTVCL